MKLTLFHWHVTRDATIIDFPGVIIVKEIIMIFMIIYNMDGIREIFFPFFKIFICYSFNANNVKTAQALEPVKTHVF